MQDSVSRTSALFTRMASGQDDKSYLVEMRARLARLRELQSAQLRSQAARSHLSVVSSED